MIFNLPCWFSYEREKLWKDADYSTLNIANGEEEDEDETKDSFDEEDEREQKDIRYVRGDVTHPIKICGSDAIIIHCVGECAISKTLKSLQFSKVKAKVSAIQTKACAESSNLRSLAIFTVFYVCLPLSLITFLCWSLYVALKICHRQSSCYPFPRAIFVDSLRAFLMHNLHLLVDCHAKCSRNFIIVLVFELFHQFLWVESKNICKFRHCFQFSLLNTLILFSVLIHWYYQQTTLGGGVREDYFPRYLEDQLDQKLSTS